MVHQKPNSDYLLFASFKESKCRKKEQLKIKRCKEKAVYNSNLRGFHAVILWNKLKRKVDNRWKRGMYNREISENKKK